MGHESLPLFVHWETLTDELLSRTEKFPKAVRHTLSQRIDNLSLDILDAIVQACYARGRVKQAHLQAINLGLTRLRVLLRLASKRAYLNRKGLEHLARLLDEAGRMVGGWLKEQRARET